MTGNKDPVFLHKYRFIELNNHYYKCKINWKERKWRYWFYRLRVLKCKTFTNICYMILNSRNNIRNYNYKSTNNNILVKNTITRNKLSYSVLECHLLLLIVSLRKNIRWCRHLRIFVSLNFYPIFIYYYH